MLISILLADFTTMAETTNISKKKAETELITENEKSTKQPREKKASKKEKEPEVKWWNDGRVSKISGLLFLLFSFVMAVSFTSYLFTLADDQSEIFNSGIGVLTDNNIQVKNALGRLGAWLANLFINNLFGLSSYLAAVASFAIGFNLLIGKNVFPLFKISLYSFIGLLWFSSAFSFANSLLQPNSILSWGGAFGNYLTGESGYLTGLLKPLGVAALLASSALVFVIVVYNINFDFLLNMFSVFSKKQEAIATTETVSPMLVPAFKDDSENIFAKDNLNDLAAPAKAEIIFDNPKSEEAEMTLLNAESGKEIKARKTEPEPELTLEVEQPVEEITADENIGSLNTNYDPTLDLSNYKFPDLELLEEHGSDKVKIDAEELERNKNQIISTLNNYQIEISKIKATIGPTVTLYEIVPAPGVRISKIKNLEDDIALSLAALGIRIIAPIPGKGTIGIEVPNAHKEVVSMRSLLASEKFQNTTADLPICLGKSISNEIFVADLAKMPHLLMAGATGQGKSVGINSILVSLLYKKHPSQLKFVLVDHKKVIFFLFHNMI